MMLLLGAMTAAGESTLADAVYVAQVPSNRYVLGSLERSVYFGIPGAAVTDLTSNPKYPGNPDRRDFVLTFESRALGTNYGQRLCGYLIPPTTGAYLFYLASDDASELWLSTDDTPANKRLITAEASWSPDRNWQGQYSPWDPAQYLPPRVSAAITLQAGAAYYVEAIHKQANYGDNLAVAWKLPGGPAPVNGSDPIPGACLAHAADPVGPSNRTSFVVGALHRQVYGSVAGTAIANLTNSAKYPSRPDQDDLLFAFESRAPGTNYGQRLFGYVIPPSTGSYVFYLASDDASQLWLSTDENPTNKRLIAEETSWSPERNWQGQYASWDTNVYFPPRSSPAIALEAGRPYYFEALHKQGEGGGHVGVAWKLPGGVAPANGSGPIPGCYLAFASDSAAPRGALRVNLYPQPALAAGGQWQVDGGPFQNSGAVVSNLSAGWHLVSLKAIPGFLAPSNLVASVQVSKTLTNHLAYPVEVSLVNWRLAPTNAVFRRYPRLVNYHHGGPVAEDTPAQFYSERLAQWDYVILGEQCAFSSARVREVNPRVRILAHIPYGQRPYTAIAAGIPPDGPNDWFLRFPDGRDIPFFSPQHRAMNPYAEGYAWPKHVADYAQTHYFNSGLYDGVSLDMLPESFAWLQADVNQDGQVNALDDSLLQQGFSWGMDRFRSDNPLALINVTPGGPGTYSPQSVYWKSLNGYLMENVLGNEFPQENWNTIWQRYRAAMALPQQRPKMVVLSVDVRFNRTQNQAQNLTSLTAEDLRRMRLGLGTTLLDDGFFSFDRGDCLHGQLWWFDEYDADLGDALGGCQKDVYASGVYHRYFQNGLVIVNPTETVQSVDLLAPLKDVTTKTTSQWLGIPPLDARILLGAAPRVNLPRCVYLANLKPGVTYQQAGSVTLEATAFAEGGVARVEFYDGDALAGSDSTPPYTFAWSFGKTNNGIHLWTARVIDTQGQSATSTLVDAKVDITLDPLNPTGALRREVYTNILGSSVADLTANAKYPSRPDQVDYVVSFESDDLESDNYGERLSGYLIPPLSGSYTFYLASDDSSELWLSTDEAPARKRLIVSEPGWNAARNWQGQSNSYAPNGWLAPRTSAPITLQAGKRYYVEALHKEGTGGDHIAVAWKRPDGPAPVNGSQPIPGECLAYALPGMSPVITTHPQSRTNAAGSAASFTVGAGGIAPLAYQWRLDGVPIAGATSPALTVPAVQLQNEGGYDVVITNRYGAVTSLVARLVVDGPRCLVYWDEVHQRMDGFGASSAFIPDPLTGDEADLFFSTNVGIGLSLFRTRVLPDGGTDELENMRQARDRGARIWSTPWSPPAAWKENNATTNGGRLLASRYPDYANLLANYAGNMKSAGIDLYAVSVQNEPDLQVYYDSCLWSSREIHDFVPYLHAALAAQGMGSTKILVGEHSGWFFDPVAEVLADPTTASKVGIVAAHGYWGEITPVNTGGKNLWQTETSDLRPLPFDPSMTNALQEVLRLHQCLTIAGVNAWHYWWLRSWGDDNQGLTDSQGNVAKRLFVLGQYSRFIRPGFYRLGTAGDNALLCSAFKDPASGTFAVVAVNTNQHDVTEIVQFSGCNPAWVRPWITAETLSLAEQGPMPVVNSRFSSRVPARSVVTFVGHLDAPSNAAPRFTAQPYSHTNLLGETVRFGITASGAEPMVYQWRHNGTPISGATNSSYFLSSAQAADAGDYDLVATNPYGAATSAVAELTMLTPRPGGLLLNGDFRYGTAAWKCLSLDGAVSSFGVSNLFNGGPALVTSVAKAGVNDWSVALNQVVAVQAGRTYTLSFFARADASRPLVTMVQRNGGDYAILGHYQQLTLSTNWKFFAFTFAANQTETNAVLVFDKFGETTGTTCLADVRLQAGGRYSLGLVANPPGGGTITAGPAPDPDSRYAHGTEVGLTAIPAAGYTFQGWSGAVTGATNPVPVTMTNSLQVTGRFTFTAQSPAITAQPQGRTNATGASVTFTVTATGTTPLSFQWRLNGTALGGATNAVYTVTNLQPAHAGNYTVVVRNAYGNATSQPALLCVQPMVAISIDGQSPRLVWAVGGPTWQVEWATNLVAPIHWDPWTGSSLTNNDLISVPLATTNGQRFYRLRWRP